MGVLISSSDSAAATLHSYTISNPYPNLTYYLLTVIRFCLQVERRKEQADNTSLLGRGEVKAWVRREPMFSQGVFRRTGCQ